MKHKFFISRRGFLSTAGATGSLAALTSICGTNGTLLNTANAAVRGQSIVWAGISDVATDKAELPILSTIIDNDNLRTEINYGLNDALLEIPEEEFKKKKFNLGIGSDRDLDADFALVLAVMSEMTMQDTNYFDQQRNVTIDLKSIRLVCFAFLFNIETLSMVGCFPVRVFANNAAIDDQNKRSLKELYLALLTTGGEDVVSGKNMTVGTYFTDKLINYPFAEKMSGPRCRVENIKEGKRFREDCNLIKRDPIIIKKWFGYSATMIFGDIFKANTYPYVAGGRAFRREIAARIGDNDRVLNTTPPNEPNLTIEPAILGWKIKKFDVEGDKDKITVRIETAIMISIFDKFAGNSDLIYKQLLIGAVEFGSFKSDDLSRDPYSYIATMHEKMLEACFVSIKNKDYRKQLIQGIKNNQDANLASIIRLSAKSDEKINITNRQSDLVAAKFDFVK